MICTNETLKNVKDSFSKKNIFYFDSKDFSIKKWEFFNDTFETKHDVSYILQDKNDTLETQMFTSLEDLISFLTSLPRKHKQGNCLDFGDNFPRLGTWGFDHDMREYFMRTGTHRQSHGRGTKVKVSICPECIRILNPNSKCDCSNS